MRTQDSDRRTTELVSGGSVKRTTSDQTQRVRCDGSGTTPPDTTESVTIEPSPLTEYYEALRSIQKLIKRIDPSIETKSTPQGQWYAVISDIIGQGHPEDTALPGYGSQHVDRVSHSADEYRSVYGNGDWITEYQCVPTVGPTPACREEVDADISDIQLEVNRPIPPTGDAAIPILIESTEELQEGLQLLSELPARPAIEPDMEGGGRKLPIEAIYSARFGETGIDWGSSPESTPDDSQQTSDGSWASGETLLSAILSTVRDILNRGSEPEEKDSGSSTSSSSPTRIKKSAAEDLLHQSAGGDADFRPDQWEAIDTLANDRSNVLLVQRTGWGKSTVYFIVTEALGDNDHGPTLVVSPMLALMRDQITNANDEFDLEGVRFASDNESEWEAHFESIHEEAVDLVFVTPRQLADPEIRERLLEHVEIDLRMVVIDEAHRISEHGHDFDADYRRVPSLLDDCSSEVPIVATTATAPEPVVDDITDHLPIEHTYHGELFGSSLQLQAIPIGNRVKRLAWLAENLPDKQQAGIVFCLTRDDVQRCTEWLQMHGYDVEAYHGRLDREPREEREELLLNNEVDALIATRALGMGLDKPDLAFVFHFQRPPNLLQYYQEIGRAGRDLESAHAVVLSGDNDDEKAEYFIERSLPEESDFDAILETLATAEQPLSTYELQRESDASSVRQCCTLLEIEGIIESRADGYVRTAASWADSQHDFEAFRARQYEQLDEFKQFMHTDRCLTKFIDTRLDGQMTGPCGHCSNCTRELYPRTIHDEELTAEAETHYKESGIQELTTRVYEYDENGNRTKIPEAHQLEPGRSLAVLNDPTYGSRVKKGKFGVDHFDQKLVSASAEVIQSEWDPTPAPEWIAFVPSRSTDGLIEDFATRLGDQLDLPVVDCIQRVEETTRQREIDSVYEQYKNVHGAYEVTKTVPEGPGLLIDDIVGSRWTLTEVGRELCMAGSGCIYPFALARRR